MAAPKGNQYTRKYTEKEALPLFEKALEYSRNNKNCLCIQDAVAESGIFSRTFYDLCEQFKVLQDIKQEINDNVIRRINKGALNGEFVSTPSIWRMKQLGEKDKVETDITTKGESINNPSEMSTDELIKRAEAIKTINEQKT